MSMTKEAAEKFVETTFNHAYDEKKIERFVAELLDGCEMLQEGVIAGQNISEAFRDKGIVSYKRLAKYTDERKMRIDVLAVKISNARRLENARTMQRNFIARYLTSNRGNQFKDAALVAFYCDESPDWRFSLVRMDYRYDEKAQKIKEDLTPARRFSFLVGKNEKTHTAQQQFLDPLQKPTVTLADLETAFNIETVSRKFFNEYRELYENLLTALENHLDHDSITKNEFDIKQVKIADFAKKLLGQIVFLYFLQKKGWLGVARDARWGTGAKDFLQQLRHRQYCEYDNFFNDILEPLFYQALAQEHPDSYYEKLQCRIPFLNGGLFEPIGNYDWGNKDILLNDSIFDEIFKVFNRYNFTVHEDAPLEKEVAIDPEMLGKVFENLIPENERKGSGTFYTPREIVHYMCQESLLNYLDSKLDIARDDLATFIYKSEVIEEYEEMATQISQTDENYNGTYQTVLVNIRTHAQAIDSALADIKICDPAIGSGAFPVGMMLEIVRLRLFLEGYSSALDKRTSHYFKLYAIKNSIYGVDIENSAVDIAKLRLWLSLVIDETNPDKIHALPNLDYKIMQGNSLLGMGIVKDLTNKHHFDELNDLQRTYFSCTSHSEKIKLEQEIINKKRDITKQENPPFDLEIDFGSIFYNHGGFDVVIANPPYIQLRIDDIKLGKLYKPMGYQTFVAIGNVYQLFYEKGINILADKGHICYITSNKWMRANYGKLSRQYLANYNPKLLLDLGANIFETATVDTNILLLQKADNQQSTQAVTLHDKTYDLPKLVAEQAVTLSTLDEKTWIILPAAETRLHQKIKRIGTPLYLWDVKIAIGIFTGFNKAFVIDAATKDALVKQDPQSAELLKPLLRGRDIKRWHADWQGLWMISTPAGWTNKQRGKQNAEIFFANSYPAIYQHLEYIGNIDIDTSKGKGLYTRDNQGDYWWELRPCKYYQDFEKEKIIYPSMTKYLPFIYDEAGFYTNDKAFIINGNHLKYLTAYFNSSCAQYWIRQHCPELQGGTRELRKVFFEHIPIPPITDSNRTISNRLTEIIEQIITAKQQDQQADTKTLEREIDTLVYQLYQLTADDIKIIEGTLA